MDILIFSVDGHHLGFDLAFIHRIIRAVKVTHLPNVPSHIYGMINLQGDVIPVINFRNVLGFEERDINLTDQFIICKTAHATVAFWIDSALAVLTYTKDKVISSSMLEKDYLQENGSNITCIEHVIKNEDDIVLVYNLNKLLDYYHVETKTTATC